MPYLQLGKWREATDQNTRRAVLRCGHDGDGRRSGAPFGARTGAAGGLPCLLLLLHPSNSTFGRVVNTKPHFDDSLPRAAVLLS